MLHPVCMPRQSCMHTLQWRDRANSHVPILYLQPHRHVTTLGGRRVRSANIGSVMGARARITSSMAARLERELLRDQATWSVTDVMRTAAALACTAGTACTAAAGKACADAGTSVGAGGMGDGAGGPAAHGATCRVPQPPVQLGAAGPDGELLFLVPAQQLTGPQQEGPDFVQQAGPTSMQAHGHPRLVPCASVVQAVHTAVSAGVQQQLQLELPLRVQLRWGLTCDPVCCWPVAV